MPDSLQTRFQHAVQQHQAGQTAQAITLYREILDDDPQHIPTPYFLGTALLQMSEFDACIEQLSQFVQQQSDVPEAHNNLGIAYKALGQRDRAADCFRKAIAVDANYASAYFNLAQLLTEQGDYTQAEQVCQQLIDLTPNDGLAYVELAKSLIAQQHWPDAEELLITALQKTTGKSNTSQGQSSDVDLRTQLAYVYVKQSRFDNAVREYETILRTAPELHHIHNSLSYVYELRGEMTKAEASARKAIDLAPNDAAAYNNLGIALRSQHRLDDACTSFEAAIHLQPDLALAHFNLGFTHLLAERCNEGWPEYSYHAQISGQPPRQFQQPRWTGEPIDGQTLLVYSDQGFGDAIQFSRFLPTLQRQTNCKLVVECQPELIELFRSLDIDATFVAEGESLPDFDQHVPLADLPQAFNVTSENCNPTPCYLKPAASLGMELQSLLQALPSDAKKIGLAWQGNRNQTRDRVRSCPWPQLSPLFEIPGIRWLSLQRETGELEQIEHFQQSKPSLASNLHSVGPMLANFAETATLLSQLDLVVTVDTAVAHLAGALGLPTWTMLCHTPDWRWLLDRRDSPWYPSMKLFRQPEWGDWPAVIQQVHEALNNAS